MDETVETAKPVSKSLKHAQKSVAWRLRPGERRFILFLGDFVAGYLALFIALYLWGQGKEYLSFSIKFLEQRVPGWFWLLPILWMILLVELYDIRRAHRRRDTFRGLGIAALISLMVYALIYFATVNGDPGTKELPRRGVAYFIGGAFVLTGIWRYTYISIFTAPQFMRRVLIIGAGNTGVSLLQVLDDLWPPPFYIVGLIDDNPDKLGTSYNGYRVLGGGDQLLEVIRQECVTDLIFAISGDMNGCMFQNLLEAEEQGVEVTTMPMMYEEILGRVPIFHLNADWILRSFVDTAHASAVYEVAKRLIDVIGGLVGSIALLFVLPFIGLAIVIDSGFPIFFLQNRLGKNGQMYKIIKFRTMRKDSEREGEVRVTTRHDDRITRVGLFLRKSHLDELPQFLNVLKGEMSLVGPRAERAELVIELQQNIPFYRARLLVKPGITGWAQVNFGYAATVEDTAIKLEYDLYYIKHRTMMMDFIIMLRTVSTVIGLRGQ